MTTQRKERKKEFFSLLILVEVTELFRIATVLIISRIEDGVRCKMFLFKEFHAVCFLSKFLLEDFLIFPGKAFHNRAPNRENEFFSCSRREEMT